MSLDIYLYIDVDAGSSEPTRITLLDRNITHNLGRMWQLAGVYDALYERDGQVAGDTWRTLMAGVEFMKTHPAECRALDSPNGWGTYKDALPWLEEVTEAFRKHPKATIGVSR